MLSVLRKIKQIDEQDILLQIVVLCLLCVSTEITSVSPQCIWFRGLLDGTGTFLLHQYVPPKTLHTGTLRMYGCNSARILKVLSKGFNRVSIFSFHIKKKKNPQYIIGGGSWIIQEKPTHWAVSRDILEITQNPTVGFKTPPDFSKWWRSDGSGGCGKDQRV